MTREQELFEDIADRKGGFVLTYVIVSLPPHSEDFRDIQ